MALMPRMDVVAVGHTKNGTVTGWVLVYRVTKATSVHAIGEPFAAMSVCPWLGILLYGTRACLSASKSASRRIDA